jgi:hypothetical protein
MASDSTGLARFSDDLKKDPPRNVSASKLDSNFRACMPQKIGIMERLNLSYDGNGWYFNIPTPPGGTAVLGAVGGVIQWLPTEACAEEG